MKLTISSKDAARKEADVLAIPYFEDDDFAEAPLSAAVRRTLASLARRVGAPAKPGKAVAVPAPKGVAASTVLFVGSGRRDGDAVEATRRAAGVAFGKLKGLGAASIAMVLPADDVAYAVATVEGLHLADYAFTRHLTTPRPAAREVVATVAAPRAGKELKSLLPAIEATCEAVKFARDLGNEPSNVLTPAELARRAEALAKPKGRRLTCKVLDPKGIRARGMGAFLGVAQGSAHEPRFIHLTYAPKGKGSGLRIGLVGKGLTFDSGGISIKPAPSMEEMKFDMCGAAAVLGVMHALAALDVRHEVHGYVAACDNMPSGSAVKPGDILVSASGRTIEVINTDAEGRLTLVDALTVALGAKPHYLVDLATLTGACAVALGAATGVMSNNDGLRSALVASSDGTGERAWPLPLFRDYRPQLESPYADVKNLGDRYGGALTAGLFLQEWVPDSVPWAHLDIAGSAWSLVEPPYGAKGATGVGVRTLLHWMRGLGHRA